MWSWKFLSAKYLAREKHHSFMTKKSILRCKTFPLMVYVCIDYDTLFFCGLFHLFNSVRNLKICKKDILIPKEHQFSSVWLLSCVWLFATPWTAACQALLSITNSRSLLKLMSIVSVMSSNLILCHPLLLPPSIFSSIRVFSNESVLGIRWPNNWSFSLIISPSN